MNFPPPKSHPVVIYGEHGNMLVTVKGDGTVEYGEGYTPDEAARIFWKAIAFHFPGRNASSVTPSHAVRVCSVRDVACVEVPPVQQCTDCPERRTRGVKDTL